MRPTADQLASRDPALAALMGVHGKSDFGADYGFGADMGFGADYNGDVAGADYAAAGDMGFGFGAAAAPPGHPAHKHPAHHGGPTHAQLMALWNKFHQQHAHSARRMAILEPNAGASVKIGRYTFSVNQALTLGTAVGVTATNQPDTNIRPQRCSMNVPSVAFITINEIKASNVSVTVGGIQDAWDFNANGVGQSLDMPTITPAMRVSVLGQYTGFVPAGFVIGQPYLFVASFKGPASTVPEG